MQPTRPRALRFRLEPRDRQILADLATFRFLTSEHVRWLRFPGRTLRAAQHRLQRLTAVGLALRCQLPLRAGSSSQERSGPVYALSASGAQLIERDAGGPPPVHGFPWRGVGPAALLHHLVAVDALVAVTVALRDRVDVTVDVLPELHFRQRMAAARTARTLMKHVLVPDGAVTLSYATGERLSFYLEVVRADVKSGTTYLIRKLRRYAQLQRSGALARLYGHQRLRAVIILASSPRRAETLRRRASILQHGRQLCWFGSYAELKGGRTVRTLTPERIAAPRFQTVDGEALSLIPPQPCLPFHAPPSTSNAGLAPHPRGDDLAEPVPPVRPLPG